MRLALTGLLFLLSAVHSHRQAIRNHHSLKWSAVEGMYMPFATQNTHYLKRNACFQEVGVFGTELSKRLLVE